MCTHPLQKLTVLTLQYLAVCLTCVRVISLIDWLRFNNPVSAVINLLIGNLQGNHINAWIAWYPSHVNNIQAEINEFGRMEWERKEQPEHGAFTHCILSYAAPWLVWHAFTFKSLSTHSRTLALSHALTPFFRLKAFYVFPERASVSIFIWSPPHVPDTLPASSSFAHVCWNYEK